MNIDEPRTGLYFMLMRKITASRVGVWLFSPILHVLDRAALSLSGGQATLTGLLGGVAVVTVTTIGARSGAPRSMPLLAIPAGESIILVASNWGRQCHPGWYHNLKKHPEVTVRYCNRSEVYHARQVLGEERAACWKRVTEVYPGYEAYQRRCAPRMIPIIMLDPGEG